MFVSVFEPGGITANDGGAISTYTTDNEDHVLQTDQHVLVELPNYSEEQGHVDIFYGEITGRYVPVQTPNHSEEQGHIDDSMFYGEIKDTLIAVQQNPEESEDAVSTYSSDVPLLEPSRTPDEPLAESLDFVAENLLACDNVNQTIQEKLYDHDTEDVDDSFTNQVVTMDTTHSYNQRLSLDIEPGFEPNSNQVTPKSPRKMLPYLGKHEPLYINDIDYVEVYEVTRTPLPIIGACWEFGSLSSVYNSYRELPAIRSRTSTLDQRSYAGSKRDIYGGSNRLLARVLSNAIGSIELGKGDIGEPSLILLPTNESLVDVDYQDDKRLCCDNNMKNLLVVSTAVTLMFIPMFGLTNLQSSMNSEGGIGVYSIAMSYVAFLLCSLFSPVVVKRYKPKPCLVFGCLAPLFYVLVNFHPTFAFFLPASFILGLSKVILWNAVSTYITVIGVEESDRKGKPADNVISKYYGIFFLLLQLAFVFGNLMSSLVLVPQPMKNQGIVQTLNRTNGTTDTDIIYNINMTDIEASIPHINATSVCGSGYCNNIATIGSQNDIDDVRKTILLGLYSLCIIASTVILIIFLDPLPNYAVTLIEIKNVFYQARNTFTMLFDGQFLLLLVMCMYTIVCNGFVVADILKVC